MMKNDVGRLCLGVTFCSRLYHKYTTKNAQIAASLLQACYIAVIKLISGCVHIACSGLVITSLLQVVNRLDAS